MKVNLYNQKGESVGEVELNPKIFEVKASQHLLAEAVRVQQSSARKGNAHTKTRGEVSGGGRKPWKQKGTGRARVGSTRSPIWRHGGVTFGPRSTRNWELKINKKAKTKALFMALSDKVKHNQFVVVDHIKLENAKTKEFVKIAQDLRKLFKISAKNLMFVLPRVSEEVIRASRNLQTSQTILANSLNIVDVLKANGIVLFKDALPVIEKVYLKEKVSK